MHYVHAHRMFEAGDYQVDVTLPEQEQHEEVRHDRRNFIVTFTGGLLTGAVLATAGVLAMNVYENAMQTTPVAQTEQVQSVESDAGSFSVGAQVLKAEQSN